MDFYDALVTPKALEVRGRKRCLVPECRHTTTVRRAPNGDWICQRHWTMVSRITKTRYRQARRMLHRCRATRESTTEAEQYCRRVWEQCKVEAIEAGVAHQQELMKRAGVANAGVAAEATVLREERAQWRNDYFDSLDCSPWSTAEMASATGFELGQRVRFRIKGIPRDETAIVCGYCVSHNQPYVVIDFFLGGNSPCGVSPLEIEHAHD